MDIHTSCGVLGQLRFDCCLEKKKVDAYKSCHKYRIFKFVSSIRSKPEHSSQPELRGTLKLLKFEDFQLFTAMI